jgi:hypothetical protein
MIDVVSAATRHARAVAAGAVVVALLVVALATFGVWSLEGHGDSAGPGPLEIKAGRTEVVYPAPRENAAWSVIAGGFLLCAPEREVTVTKVAPLHDSGAETFSAFTRAFTIGRLDSGRVGEPVIGGYGTPPWIGGKDDPHPDRLIGDLQSAEGLTLTPPRCEDTTSAPKEPAVELLLAVAAGKNGAVVDGVTVDYEAGGQHYRTRVDVEMTLCGTQVHDSDCTV